MEIDEVGDLNMSNTPFEKLTENIYRIPIPVPFPMKYIYCYLFKEQDGWSLVDTGFNYPEAVNAWKNVFEQLRIQPEQISAIYLTHFHPDHFGLAGWMQELTGALVYMSKVDIIMAERVWGKNSQQSDAVGAIFRQNGVPERLAEQIEENMKKLSEHVQPFPSLTILEEEEVQLGGMIWKVISVPGHSDGMINFYQPEKRILLAADHVLDKITPNISLWPGGNANPLEDYFSSLNKVAALNIRLALPAHGKVIDEFSERILAIRRHHDKRLKQMFSLALRDQTAYEIAGKVFSNKQLSPHQWRFAIAETLAHLEYLVLNDELMKTERNGTIFYRQNTEKSA
jgi:glyoxylase-like metal-dependent hydrolase (beta-lactamase superfamily II)